MLIMMIIFIVMLIINENDNCDQEQWYTCRTWGGKERSRNDLQSARFDSQSSSSFRCWSWWRLWWLMMVSRKENLIWSFQGRKLRCYRWKVPKTVSVTKSTQTFHETKVLSDFWGFELEMLFWGDLFRQNNCWRIPWAPCWCLGRREEREAKPSREPTRAPRVCQEATMCFSSQFRMPN